MKYFVTFLLLLCLPCAAMARDVPSKVSASYTLNRDAMNLGTIHETFARKGDAYTITSEAEASELVALFVDASTTRSSTGQVINGRLRPLKFQDKGMNGKSKTADFDWDKKDLTLRYKNKTKVLSLPDDSHDRLSFAYNFMYQPPNGTAIQIHMTDGKKLNDYLFTEVGREKLTTPMGEADTVHLARQVEGDESNVEVWLSPAHYYLPLRIRFTDKNGSTFDQRVTKISF